MIRNLPEELQFWHKFGNIVELNLKNIFDEKNGDYNSCIFMTLTNITTTHAIKLFFYNVNGKINFDVKNGFFSGFTIDDCSGWGYERDCKFRISSLEQDIEFAFYCEKIKVEFIC